MMDRIQTVTQYLRRFEKNVNEIVIWSLACSFLYSIVLQ